MEKLASVYQTAAHPGVSSQYAFIPTTAVLEELDKQGWYPHKMMETRVMKADNSGFQKHLVRLRHKELAFSNVGDLIPELVLENSHNRSSAFVIRFGIFRLACSNGMVVASHDFGAVRIRHVGYKADDVIEASYRVLEKAPEIAQKVQVFQQIETNHIDRRALAYSGMALRWDDPVKAPVSADTLLVPKRTEDYGDDLFTSMNRVQENLIKGGQRGRATNRARITTRPVQQIDGDLRINTGLWMLTDELARVKQGGRVRSQWPEGYSINDPRRLLHTTLAESI